MKIKILELLIIALFQYSFVSSQTALPNTCNYGQVYLSYSTSDYSKFSGISTKTKGGLVSMGFGLCLGAAGILQLKNNLNIDDDPFKEVIVGVSFFAVGTIAALSGGIGDLVHHFHHHNSRWSVIAPNRYQVGIAYNF